jgi:hypothetical protein
MGKINKVSKKPYSVRLTLKNENELKKYLIDNPNLDRSDIINISLGCFLFSKGCKAKIRLFI